MSSGTTLNPFFDVGYRVVAIALCFYCGRQLWYGLVERKITSFDGHTDVLDWLLDWSKSQVFHRDTAPVRYWITMGMQTFVMVACFIGAVIGWWQPNT